jgi:hypothetical protein
MNALELQLLIERGRTYILETWGLYVPPYQGWKPGYTIDNGVNTYGDTDIQHEAG